MNTLRLEFETPKEHACVLIDSIGLEAEKDFHSRSKVRLVYDGSKILMLVWAKDLSSMRAAVNTYLRWIIMCNALIYT